MSRLLLAAAVLTLLGAGADSQPADKPVSKVDEILARLPKDARPGRGGDWDEFNAPKANDWIKHNVPLSVDFSGDFVLESVSIAPVAEPLNPDHVVAWDVSVSVQMIPMRFDGVEGEAILSPGQWTIRGDEQMARNAKQWRKGDKVTIRGKFWSLRVAAEQRYLKDGHRVPPYPFATYTLALSRAEVVRVGSTKVNAKAPEN